MHSVPPYLDNTSRVLTNNMQNTNRPLALASFADRSMRRAHKRLSEQAKNMRCFDALHLFDETKLDSWFTNRLKQKLKVSVRGFGYWCWKPQIILQSLEKLPDNGLLLYVDAGCHLNSKAIGRLTDYVKMVQENPMGLLAFQAVPPDFHENGRQPFDGLTDNVWSKGDVFDHFGVRDCPEITDSATFFATAILMRKTPEVIDFMSQWRGVFLNNFNLVDDSQSNCPNLPGFIENRHDQTIFSILCKLSSPAAISAYELDYPAFQNVSRPDWGTMDDFPIQAKRDRKRSFWAKLILKRKKVVKASQGNTKPVEKVNSQIHCSD